MIWEVVGGPKESLLKLPELIMALEERGDRMSVYRGGWIY